MVHTFRVAKLLSSLFHGDPQMADAASDAEKLAVAKGFLLASPPGEVREVAKDVTKLVPRGLLSDTALRGIMHTYNVENCLPMQLPNEEESKRLVICQEGEVLFATNSTITLILSTERVSLRNFWYLSSWSALSLISVRSGRWKSKWTLANVSPDSSAATLAGRIDLHVHYFEDGNLQLLSHKDVAAAQVCGGARSLAQAVLDTIRAEEHVVHSNLEDMYINMTEETFKEMRRVMPGTSSPFSCHV
ncbi:hypothetical protein DYB32_001577 [Aphanomyces invadans]|uniref:F-actin-capping protein subunit alpha n=1 Tax=Aphanomyces invadans TaxID=157072 RepID=A0A3R6Z912_9STRA|nr:hypothetical protein DYB32_001577 [Aphanomyces invadans]